MLSRGAFFAIFLGAIVCASCQSKPVAKRADKATRTAPGPLYSAELAVEIPESPQDMESVVILSHGVQSCLRAAILKSGDDFSVSFTGQLSAKGVVSGVEVEHPYPSLRTCLAKELATLKFAAGDAGPFKFVISRVRTTPSTSKTFLLDLNEPRKFQ